MAIAQRPFNLNWIRFVDLIRASLLLTTTFLIIFGIFIVILLGHPQLAVASDRTILNVSFDPTREFYEELNTSFARMWQGKTGRKITVQQSHGGSGKQARAVIDGLEADVVTLALAYDIDQIARHAKLLPENWQATLPHNSAPYTSTIVLLVRKGNPKAIKDWNDLTKAGVEVITPNPKTSGGARWNYLAALTYALKHNSNDEEKSRKFMQALFSNVPVLDTGARGATTTFVQREIGDVLIAWENEALLAVREFSSSGFEIVIPSITILAEPSVAIVDKNVEKHGTREEAKAYLEFLYTEEAQNLAAKHFMRPRLPAVQEKYAHLFPAVAMVTISDPFGGWQNAQKKYFDNGGEFDKIYNPGGQI